MIRKVVVVKVEETARVFPTRRGNDHRTWQRNRDQYGHESNSGTNNSPQSCWRCGQTGHIQRDCSLSIVRPEPKKQQGGPNVYARGATYSTCARVYIQLTLRGRNIMCLLDMGCDTTLFPYSLVRRIKGVSVTESNKRASSK